MSLQPEPGSYWAFAAAGGRQQAAEKGTVNSWAFPCGGGEPEKVLVYTKKIYSSFKNNKGRGIRSGILLPGFKQMQEGKRMARKRKRLPAGFTERSDGRLQLSFTVEGKRYQVCGQTVEDCKSKELLKRQQIAAGIQKREDPTLEQYAEEWQKNRERRVKESTQRTQEHILRTVCTVPVGALQQSLGKHKLRKITAADLEELQGKLLEGWRTDEDRERKNAHRTERKRSTQAVNDYMALLGHLLRDAKKKRIIDYNPIEVLEPLKRTEERARDTVHRALSQAEQKALFSHEDMKSSAYYRVFKFALLTGMRCGEIGALQLRDIRKGFVHVERTITRSSAGFYIGQDAKTEAGRRTIPITEEIREVLEEQKRVNQMLYGNELSPTATVFRAPRGGLLLVTPADRELRALCRKNGIPPITMHGLRATFATRALEAGMNPRTLQEILGHTDFGMTMNLYGHVLENTKKDEMSKLRIVI